VVALASQLLLTPVLTDNTSSIGYWSILTGFKQASEQSTMYNVAGGFYLLSNLVIMIALVVFLIFVIKDIARRNN
jgi:hypothetical protein